MRLLILELENELLRLGRQGIQALLEDSYGFIVSHDGIRPRLKNLVMNCVYEDALAFPNLISESEAARNKFGRLLARLFLICSINVANFVEFLFFDLFLLLLITLHVFFILHGDHCFEQLLKLLLMFDV